MERTLVIIKPDGVRRGLIGQVITRYEQKGFKIIAGKLMMTNRETIEEHYIEHKGKSFYEELIQYFLEGLIFVMVVEGESAIEIVRNIHGNKDPQKALPGTIRGDFANSTTKNIVHASDCLESAKREVSIWFPELKYIRSDSEEFKIEKYNN